MKKEQSQPVNNFFCPHSVLEDAKFKNLSISTRYLYVILCKLANRYADKKDGWFFRSIMNLSEDAYMCKASISSAKKELIDNHFIDVKRGYYQHSKLRTYDYFKLNGFRFKSKK